MAIDLNAQQIQVEVTEVLVTLDATSVTVDVTATETPALIVSVESQGLPGRSGSYDYREMPSVTILGQTSFQLQAIVQRPDLSAVSLNGAKAFYGSDYTIDGLLLTWISGITLAPDDQIEILYF
jgi:hypothetical protein